MMKDYSACTLVQFAPAGLFGFELAGSALVPGGSRVAVQCLDVAHCRGYQEFGICSVHAPCSRVFSLAEQVPELTKICSSEIQDFHPSFCFASASLDPEFYHR